MFAGSKPLLSGLQAAKDGAPFTGDRATLTTLGAAPGRTTARFEFVLARRAAVSLEIETEPTYANNEIKGVPVGAPLAVDWSAHADAPAPVPMQVGSDWPSGVYAVRIDADDGRVGFAPLVVRPSAPQSRIAVVMPTSTWSAYNFYDADADGDGWGDTWYARWRTKQTDLTRPQANRGVPYRYRSYDLAFQHWLAQSGKHVDTYADEHIERFATSAELRAGVRPSRLPGPHRVRDHTPLRPRRRVPRRRREPALPLREQSLPSGRPRRRPARSRRRVARPRPAGVRGSRQPVHRRRSRRAQSPSTVVGADVAPWAFAGTGLANGSTFGLYGIEIDARSPASPPNTLVLATITDLFGPGRTAEMTYYEHPSGARVFSAGALDFGGQVLLWPQTAQLLANVWQRLAPSV